MNGQCIGLCIAKASKEPAKASVKSMLRKKNALVQSTVQVKANEEEPVRPVKPTLGIRNIGATLQSLSREHV